MVPMGCETRRCRGRCASGRVCHAVPRRRLASCCRPGGRPVGHDVVGRYYDPQTGQFLSVDPLVDETGQPYTYTGGDPVDAADPTGLVPGCQWWNLVCQAASVADSLAQGAAGVLAGNSGPQACSGLGWQVAPVCDVGALAGVALEVGGGGDEEGLEAGGDLPAIDRNGDSAAELRRVFNNSVRPTYWKAAAADDAEAWSPSNLARMEKGQAPIGADGYPMELHHKIPLSEGGTNDFSNLEPMTRTDHRLGA